MADESTPVGSRDLGKVLETARSYIRKKDDWQAVDYNRLRRHCDDVGIRDGLSITLALRACLGEITVRDLHARDDPGYDGLCEGHDLYEARWYSTYVKREMYLKFSLYDERLIIVSFHESRPLSHGRSIQK